MSDDDGVGVAYDYRAAIAEARRVFRRFPPTLAVHDPRAGFLLGSDGNVTSQNGEDGVIAALFERIGCRNRRCFEVGAHDGRFLSNTWALRQDGWVSVLIEADAALFERLLSGFWDSARVVHERVRPHHDDLDRILAEADAPADLDLGVIDVDGPDVFVWEAMKNFVPRVMLVEYNPSGDGVQGGQPDWQAGLARVADVGRRKGYALVATVVHNAFFVLQSAMKEVRC